MFDEEDILSLPYSPSLFTRLSRNSTYLIKYSLTGSMSLRAILYHRAL